MVSAADLVQVLTSQAQTVATAESLTAGLLAATIADVPGASAVLRGGLVVYATDLKASLAGVDESVLEEYGPVSSATAAQMALGAQIRCGADWGVSLTGVAGPTPQAGHPVGEVWLGLAGPHGSVATSNLDLPPEFSRKQIRGESVARAISGLLNSIRGH
nr:nicotinamide-nucleotide amidohydrolase family protein [Corynebacterium sputi]